MEIKISSETYRRDIDGLRAIAVIAVILFHFGYLANGYLGVDVFFVISGYLITKIIFNEVTENRFSLAQFYLRRIRRIIPLVLFICSLAGIIGLYVMLPDDLENLSQSIIATNLFSNNVLQYITTHNYWDVVNEYKPLMHTWSLGIEEQYYLIYPIIFMILEGKKKRFILPILLGLTAISLLTFIVTASEPVKFYLLPSRFFELSIGGLGSIFLNGRVIVNKFKSLLIIALAAILFINIDIPHDLRLFLTVIISLGVLVSAGGEDWISSFILENKLMVWIGKISFSLYMWHQLILAFARYAFLESYSVTEAILISVLILILSVLSYFLIEEPFRNKSKVKTSVLLWIVGSVFIFSTGISLYIYMKGGVMKDIPELGITKSNAKRNMHAAYNDKIYKLDKSFTNNNKVKILIVGNSFARDWANVLLESKYGNLIEISYIYDINNAHNVNERLNEAKYIFFSNLTIEEFNVITKNFNIDTGKVWMIGTKSFGSNNGVYYNRKGSTNYCSQRVSIGKEFLERNDLLKKQWKDKFINLIGMIIDKNGKVPVFAEDCKFISQDCRHLTSSGAKYFAHLINTNSTINIK